VLDKFQQIQKHEGLLKNIGMKPDVINIFCSGCYNAETASWNVTLSKLIKNEKN